MLVSKNSIIKVLILILIIFLPWFINNQDSSENFPVLDDSTLNFYQKNICDITLFQFNKINSGINVDFIFDTTADIKCFGRINGADYKNNEIIVYLGTNINIDLLIQSLFWLVLFSFLPKTKKFQIKYKNIYTFVLLFLLFIHFSSEIQFYNFYSKTFLTSIEDSYTIYSLLLTMFVVIRVFLELIETRYYSIINYFPLLFVLVGTFHSLNLNIFLIFLSLIGLVALKEKTEVKKIFLAFLLIVFYWIYLINTDFEYFDVDKIKGFHSSAYNSQSVLFWSVMYFLFISGFIKTFNDSKNFINLSLLKKIFQISGAATVIVSLIASSSFLYNFFVYFYLGLNKTPSKSMESVAGNAWRGISSSAESIGEFFMFIIIFTIFINYYKKNKYSLTECFLVLLCIYGLYRSNNFAAFFSGVVFLLIFILLIFIKNQKFKYTFILLAFLSIPLISIFFINNLSIEDSSRKLIQESIEISYLENLETNEFGLTAIDEDRFLEFLNSQEEYKDNASSSLTFLIERYHYSNRNYVPNLTSFISTVATSVNRSEKWGVFFGKYNPNLQTLLFGTGVNNLTNYYFEHFTKVNDGLVLPHSSLLSYLVFVGILGVTFISLYFLYLFVNNKDNKIYIILNFYFLINLLKNDSLLYFNSFLLFIFVLNFHKIDLNNLKNESF